MRKIPRALDDDQRRAILSIPYSGKGRPQYASSYRNLVAMRLMLNGGLRCAEVLGIDTHHVTWTGKDAGLLRVVNGKGGKDRVLQFGERDLFMMAELKKLYGFRKGPLFRKKDGTRLSDRMLRRVIHRYSVKAGIDPPIGPHILRHTFATRLYTRTKNIRMVQMALGHASINTTQIYTHIADPDRFEATRALGDED